ncbi:MAG: hypothetical protein ACRCXN_08595 [Bacteroidales bacterium]
MTHSSSKASNKTKKRVNNILSEYHTLDSESKDIVLSKLISQSNPNSLFELSIPKSKINLKIDLNSLGGFVYLDRSIYIKNIQGITLYKFKNNFANLIDEISNGSMKYYFFIRKSYIIPYSLFMDSEHSELSSARIQSKFQTLGISYSPNAEKQLRQNLIAYRKGQFIKKHKL